MARFFGVVTLAAALAGSPAAAQKQVYEPLPPPGSAYVRFVNGLGRNVTLKPDFLPPQPLGTAVDQRVTSYYVVEKVAGRSLTLEAQDNGDRVTLRVEPGSFVTVIVQQSTGQTVRAVVLVDHTDFNQSRARLAFYNATPACDAAKLSLVPDGSTVFQDVAPGTVKTRSVNPVVAQVRATCDGQATPPFPLQNLEAGGMYSIWLMMPAGSPAAFVTRDTTAPWKP